MTSATHRHYKGQLYRFLARALHSETQEPMVVYQAMYGEKLVWVRPQAMFDGTVEVDGKTIPRFALLEDTSR